MRLVQQSSAPSCSRLCCDRPRNVWKPLSPFSMETKANEYTILAASLTDQAKGTKDEIRSRHNEHPDHPSRPGLLIDEQALEKALEQRSIAGAAPVVFEITNPCRHHTACPGHPLLTPSWPVNSLTHEPPSNASSKQAPSDSLYRRWQSADCFSSQSGSEPDF